MVSRPSMVHNEKMSEPPDPSVGSRAVHVHSGRVQVPDVPESARPFKWKPGQSGNPSGRGGLYHECRKLAAEASPTAMRRLIELMDAVDERVAYMAATAILDRSGVKPMVHDPREEERALSAIPLKVRKARLAELVVRAQSLLAGSATSQRTADAAKILSKNQPTTDQGP
jgi:hypothetical protein